MANSVDPDPFCSWSTLFASILYSSAMLGNYLQQTTSVDDIFRFIFFLGALRIKVSVVCYWHDLYSYLLQYKTSREGS